MIDFKQDSTGDISFSSQGFSLVDGVSQIAQNVAIRLRTFLGEYYLNTDVGLPYYEDIFVKPANEIRVDSLFKNEILETTGILELVSYKSSFDDITRAYSIAFSARTVTGETIDQELELTI